ncbi:MAG TPA: methyltransferase domain-containing protein [archaeon]|nr:methyltransferase domain-containing protein [archaeon]HLD80783.1 methyltransferase domain-containing protein [archaeon]
MAHAFFDSAGKRHYLKQPSANSFEAGVVDYFEDLKRGPQIITQKDAGLVLAFTGVGPGWRVAEAGAGSGALTLFLANAVRPSGRVYSYDNRAEHLELARKNIEAAGLSEFVEFRHGDVFTGLKETGLDLVVLDLPEPWKALDAAEKALRLGGFIACYVPSFEQLKETIDAFLARKAFSKPRAMESILREFKAEKGVTRPENTGLLHTGFLVFSRKV